MKSFLSNLPRITKRSKKRLGRGLGSGKGSKSGRGTTRHQKARESIPLAFEGGQGRMIKRFPLLRGRARNKPSSIRPLTFGLHVLERFEDGAVVDRQTLVKKGFVSEEAKRMDIKILGNGTLKKKLTVKLPVSKGARKAIEKAGGTVIS